MINTTFMFEDFRNFHRYMREYINHAYNEIWFDRFFLASLLAFYVLQFVFSNECVVLKVCKPIFNFFYICNIRIGVLLRLSVVHQNMIFLHKRKGILHLLFAIYI